MYEVPANIPRRVSIKQHIVSLLLLGIILMIGYKVAVYTATIITPVFEQWHTNDGFIQALLFCTSPLLLMLGLSLFMIISHRVHTFMTKRNTFLFGCGAVPSIYLLTQEIAIYSIEYFGIARRSQKVTHDSPDSDVHFFIISTALTWILTASIFMLLWTYRAKKEPMNH